MFMSSWISYALYSTVSVWCSLSIHLLLSNVMCIIRVLNVVRLPYFVNEKRVPRSMLDVLEGQINVYVCLKNSNKFIYDVLSRLTFRPSLTNNTTKLCRKPEVQL